MAQHESQYEYGKQSDEYGNPIRQTDEVVGTNMGHVSGGSGYGGQQMKSGMGGGAAGGGMLTATQHQREGTLHRTASGSSSSSEDDGEGGRRKKGLKQKIKEKLPGGHDGQQDHQMHGTTTTEFGQEGQHEEKKGIMDKIKEKLPGGHN